MSAMKRQALPTRKILVFTLSLILSLVLGVITETEWVFYVIGQWRNGGIFFLFLVPWALFLFYSLLAPQASSSDRELRLMYGFICFSLAEAILFMCFIFICLPLIPHYIDNPPNAPARAYLPHVLFAIVFVGVVILGIRNIGLRFRKGKEGVEKGNHLKGGS
jgi:hypothetical protein